MAEDPKQTPDPPSPSADPMEGIGDKAKHLIENANAEAASFRSQLREAEERNKATEERLAKLEKEHESEQERAVREAQEKGREEAKAESDKAAADYERRIAMLRIESAAAGSFADPHDAVSLLPLDDLLSERDEASRDKKVEAALAKLLEEKPYLAANGSASGKRPPLVTQGARGSGEGRSKERSWIKRR